MALPPFRKLVTVVEVVVVPVLPKIAVSAVVLGVPVSGFQFTAFVQRRSVEPLSHVKLAASNEALPAMAIAASIAVRVEKRAREEVRGRGISEEGFEAGNRNRAVDLTGRKRRFSGELMGRKMSDF